MNTEEKSDEPRIVVDNAWKDQVAAEKAAAQAGSERAATSDTDSARRKPAGGKSEASAMQIPPASFEILVSTYSTQAMVALGFFPDPLTGETSANRPLAKHLIDMLGVIEKISAGNISEDESSMISSVLHQLRMAWLQSGKQAAEDDGATAKEKKPVIELP